MAKGKCHSASWLVDEARKQMRCGDMFAAKSWLLTAKTLFPTDFSIQYEEFIMEKEAGNVQSCAKLFYDMMSMFSKEPVLWDELSHIFHSQDSNRAHMLENSFIRDMFDSLPENHQKELLLKYANHQVDLVDKCRTSLLVLKRFKGGIKDQALKLITTLRNSEEKEHSDSPLNIYRKMIVCDVLPLMLRSADVQISPHKVTKYQNASEVLCINEELLLVYLNDTIEFFMAHAIQKSSLAATQDFGFEIDENISSWNQMHENLVMFANKLGWSNVLKFKDKIDPTKNRPLKSRWKTLWNAREGKHPMGLFYAVLQLHLYTVLEYCSAVCNNKNFSQSISPSSEDCNQLVLVDNIDLMTRKESSHHNVARTSKKKKKTEESGTDQLVTDVNVIIHPGLIGQVNENLGDCLQIAIETQNLLTSAFNAEFDGIRQRWKMAEWNWTQTFDVDALTHQGKFLSVVSRLATKHSLKSSLQTASSLFVAGQRKEACHKALEALSYFPPSSFDDILPNADAKSSPNPEGRTLLLLSCQPNDVISYVAQIVFAALKARMNCDDHPDYVTGHLIVLSQLMWSKNEEIFLALLKSIKSRFKFKYELFFKYVTQVDILEEFAYLHSTKTVVLELLAEESSKRTITRGVDKEAQGDFKSALERQMQRNNEPIKKIVYEFLSNEKDSIMEVL